MILTYEPKLESCPDGIYARMQIVDNGRYVAAYDYNKLARENAELRASLAKLEQEHDDLVQELIYESGRGEHE